MRANTHTHSCDTLKHTAYRNVLIFSYIHKTVNKIKHNHVCIVYRVTLSMTLGGGTHTHTHSICVYEKCVELNPFEHLFEMNENGKENNLTKQLKRDENKKCTHQKRAKKNTH